MLVNNFLDWKSRTNLPDWMNDDYLIICYQLDAAFEGFSSLVFQFLIPSLPSSDPKKFHFIHYQDLTLACLRTYPFDLIVELVFITYVSFNFYLTIENTEIDF